MDRRSILENINTIIQSWPNTPHIIPLLVHISDKVDNIVKEILTAFKYNYILAIPYSMLPKKSLIVYYEISLG